MHECHNYKALVKVQGKINKQSKAKGENTMLQTLTASTRSFKISLGPHSLHGTIPCSLSMLPCGLLPGSYIGKKTSITSCLHFLFFKTGTHGNGSMSSASRHFKRCSHIAPASKLSSLGSCPEHSAVANARTKRPQSCGSPFPFCQLLASRSCYWLLGTLLLRGIPELQEISFVHLLLLFFGAPKAPLYCFQK